MTTALIKDNELSITPDLLRQYPFLKRLIHFFITSSHVPHATEQPFLHHFFENLLSNLPLAKSRYRYDKDVTDFALCLSILSERNAYEFLLLNIPGVFPNLTTIQAKLANKGFRAYEGKLCYENMKKYMSTTNSKFAFYGEDCTTVLRKIAYDVRSNSFVGFTPPLDENGLSVLKHFQTNSFEELRRWFQEEDISNFLNLHMIQPVSANNTNSHPFVLAAYGTNGKYTSIDVIRRWFTIFEKSSLQSIRVLGYSTDADTRYLLAMKWVSGFFSNLLNSPTTKYPSLLNVVISTSWTWFYLPTTQLFLCMQDPVHICTKLRNKLLSTSARHGQTFTVTNGDGSNSELEKTKCMI